MTTAGVLVVGVGQGAEEPLVRLLSQLPRTFPVPVVVVCHGDDPAMLARLQRCSALPLEEAVDKEPLRPGRVLVAPSGYHLLLDGYHVALATTPPEHGARPSVAALFESAGEVFGDDVVAALLGDGGMDAAAATAALPEGATVVDETEGVATWTARLAAGTVGVAP